MTDTAERNIIEQGDYLVDAETGEILGLIPEHARFAVTDRATAEWVLSKMFDEASAIAALEARKEALVENIESMQLDHERRSTFLYMRFGEELKTWAHKELDGKKTRTLKTVWGRLSFRRKPSRLSIYDEERALAWTKQHQPQAVKTTEKVLLSELTLDDDASPPGFEWTAEEETFSIKSGIES